MNSDSLEAPPSAPAVVLAPAPATAPELPPQSFFLSPPPPTTLDPPPPSEIGLFYYGVTLRQLNVAVVTILIILVILVLVLTALKARRGWFTREQGAGGNGTELTALQAMGNRGLLFNSGSDARRGLDEATIQAVGKIYTYSAPLYGRLGEQRVDEGQAREQRGGEEGIGGGEVSKPPLSGWQVEGMGTGHHEELKLKVDEEEEEEGRADWAADGERECIVCLAEYRDAEVLKRLSACGHSFHQECIDTWLRCNTSCPLCRTSLQPKGDDSGSAEEELPLSSGGGAAEGLLGSQPPNPAVFVAVTIEAHGGANSSQGERGSSASGRTGRGEGVNDFVSIPIR